MGQEDWRVGAGLLAALLLVVAAGISSLRTATTRPPVAKPPVMVTTHPLEIIGYFDNGWSEEFPDSFPDARDHANELSEILAFWYSIGGDGAIVTDSSRPQVLQYFKNRNVKFGILANNKKGAGESNSSMLTDPQARSRAIGNLVDVVQRNGYSSVNIDFELIPPESNVGLTKLVCGLRDALPKGVGLSVAVFPPLDVDPEINGAYDYKALSDCSDYLVVMLYDFYHPGGIPGPISPNPWVQRNIDHLLRMGIPAQKLVLAAGLYGRDWTSSGGEPQERTLSAILQLARDKGLTIRRERVSQNPYLEYTDEQGVHHSIWFQDDLMLKQRLELAQARNLRGVALWRLGFEPPSTWEVIRAHVGKPKT